MIPQSFIQELLSRVDVVDVVGRHVQLRKAGANFLGLCPFHGEKSPSFTVSPSKQFYHCFGCGAHGTAIGFLMEHAGLGYVEAIEELARSAGLTVPHEAGRSGGGERRSPDLLEVLAQAERHFSSRLKDSPRAISYLKARGLTGTTAKKFAIGYAPDQWQGLEAAVADYAAPELLAAGLVIEAGEGAPSGGEEGVAGGEGRPAGRRRYDRFRDRIMFPIRNPRGQVIGFGGRVLDRGEPKYMNSPETPVFSKGHELYGLYEARDALRQSNCALVVEGYMDVVMLAQHGVGHAVATLGTSTTPDHVRKLLRLVDRVVFAFDGDAAGRKAAWRALGACLPMAADTKRLDFLFLPPEHDPDSYVRAHGQEGFEQLTHEALPLSEFLVRELSSRVDLEQPEGRARFCADACGLLAQMPAAALRMQLVHRCAELARISVAEMSALLAAAPPPAGSGRGGAPASAGHGPQDGQSVSMGAPRGYRSGSQGWGPRGGRGAAEGGAQGGNQGGFQRGTRGGYGENGQGRRADFNGRFRPVATGPGALRSTRQPPDLQRRLRLLSALHPALAREPIDPRFLPSELLDWLERLRGLPAGASFAVLCEALRADLPERVAELQRDVAQDRVVVAEMGLEDARKDFEGAIVRLRDRGRRSEIDALASKGLKGQQDKEKLLELHKEKLLELQALDPKK